jgi:cell division transport system permease protein
MFISFARALKFSLQDIWRNVWLSIVTIVILVLALFSVNLLLAVQVISGAAVETVRDKIDISLYLRTEASESDILALRAKISALENVREVNYTSKQAALEAFQNKHQNNLDVISALRELDENPLSPSLVIHPKDLNRYDDLITELNKISDPIIETRNFDDHKLMLEKINGITDRVSEAGFLVSLLFIFITLLVLYNTIRVAIYTHRQEIAIMRLVGGSSWFIRSPFLISSILYTLIGMIITTILFYFFLTLLQPYLETFFLNYNFNIVSYFSANFVRLFILEFLGAAVINMVASLVAVRKYSNI